MEDDLNFLKIEDNLIYSKIDNDLNFLKTKDFLNILLNQSNEEQPKKNNITKNDKNLNNN